MNQKSTRFLPKSTWLILLVGCLCSLQQEHGITGLARHTKGGFPERFTSCLATPAVAASMLDDFFKTGTDKVYSLPQFDEGLSGDDYQFWCVRSAGAEQTGSTIEKATS